MWTRIILTAYCLHYNFHGLVSIRLNRWRMMPILLKTSSRSIQDGGWWCSRGVGWRAGCSISSITSAQWARLRLCTRDSDDPCTGKNQILRLLLWGKLHLLHAEVLSIARGKRGDAHANTRWSCRGDEESFLCKADQRCNMHLPFSTFARRR